MALTGVKPLDNDAIVAWDETTTEFIKDFYDSNPSLGVANVNSLITFVSQDPPYTGRRLSTLRKLEDGDEELMITYDQTVAYEISPDSPMTEADIVTQPFMSDQSRAIYSDRLRETGDPAFENIQGTSQITQAGSEDSGLSTGAIIGIAVGGAAGLALLVGGGYYMFSKRGGGGYKSTGEDQPPQSLALGGGDDVSALHEPNKPYGDQR